jgi:hypothetical protein
MAFHPERPTGKIATGASQGTSSAMDKTATSEPSYVGPVESIHTSGGDLVKGMTWDDALPLLGNDRLALERFSPDGFAAVYRIDDKVYAVTFQRPSLPQEGPYTIRGFYRRADNWPEE